MLPDFITLEVATPERQIVVEDVDELQLPARDGYLGILPGHAPLITELGMGELSYRKGNDVFYATIFGGFAEILPDRVIVLAETAERAEEVDVDRAHAAQGHAEKLLAHPGPDTDWETANLALQRSRLRLQVAAKGGGVAAREEQQSAP